MSSKFEKKNGERKLRDANNWGFDLDRRRHRDGSRGLNSNRRDHISDRLAERDIACTTNTANINNNTNNNNNNNTDTDDR